MNKSTVQKKISEKFLTIEVGGELLFRKNDALGVIEEYEKNRTIILGMNFWQKKGDNLVEINSADYSRISRSRNAIEKTINEARKLIEHGISEEIDFVSFVLGEN